jgi:hypothetical protein
MFDLDKVRTLSQAYKDAGLGGTWSGGFLASLAAEGKQPRGNGVNILRDLMEKGEPNTWPSWNKAKDYLTVAESCLRKDEADTLRSFAAQIFQGRDLTDRQKAYAERIMAGSQRPITSVTVDDELRTLTNGLCRRKSRMSPFYWGNKPATSNRIDRVISKILTQTTVEVEDVEFLKSQFKSVVALWNSIPEKIGTLCQVRPWHIPGRGYKNDSDTTPIDTLVLGNRSFSDYGMVMVDVLIEGAPVAADAEKLIFPKVRKPRAKKSV